MKDADDTVAENGIQGSATCCLVLVDTLQGRLTSANIGDSGFVLIGAHMIPLPKRSQLSSSCTAATFGQSATV